MRKKSKYKPRPMLVNPLGYVLESMTRVANHDSYLIDMKIKNHQALTALTQGHATRQDMDMLIAMANIVEAMYRMGIGGEYADEVRDGVDALYTVGVRGSTAGRFILKASEMSALNLLIELHDAQMEVSTIKDIERALKLVDQEFKMRKMRPIVKKVEVI